MPTLSLQMFSRVRKPLLFKGAVNSLTTGHSDILPAWSTTLGPNPTYICTFSQVSGTRCQGPAAPQSLALSSMFSPRNLEIPCLGELALVTLRKKLMVLFDIILSHGLGLHVIFNEIKRIKRIKVLPQAWKLRKIYDFMILKVSTLVSLGHISGSQCPGSPAFDKENLTSLRA